MYSAMIGNELGCEKSVSFLVAEQSILKWRNSFLTLSSTFYINFVFPKKSTSILVLRYYKI